MDDSMEEIENSAAPLRAQGEAEVEILAVPKVLDMGNLRQFSEELDRRIEGGCKHTVLNLKRLEATSGATWACFFKVNKHLKAIGGELVLSEPSKYCAGVIATLGTEKVIDVFPSDEEALQHIRQRPERRRALRAGPVPRGVGYWGGSVDDPEDLPTPQSLVRTLWQYGRRARIARYLADGYVLRGPCGCAVCRFRDCGEGLGSCDLTDGVWIWPQRLEHYVLKHAVSLPSAFIETMRLNAWKVPTLPDIDEMAHWLAEEIGFYGDLSEWIEWSEVNCRR